MGKPSKNALARSYKKRSFFLACLQDLARSCEIFRNFAGILHKIPARFLQDLAGSCRLARKKDLSCKSVFTGKFEVKFGKWANPNQLASKIYIGEWATCIATTDYKRKYLEGKKWRKEFSSPNSPSYSPLQNFPLYGTILKYYPSIIGSGLYVASYASDIHLLQMGWLEIITLF